ncbi:MAG TPA: carboxylating nicotinate-nucleotide diphosphorylase [Arenimonas sp.]|nr:carboxylating nicotinate-nucleotide diphosphorylase [Arenimonas sp.]HPO23828.1 carboxylating nicotinate-nucleotide diphosphorylase [Arenimonas sp.]HPW31852.1 carboxylating nicotinate-nucleotide diphosphorylase [Arenimonas sp.]
MNFNPPDQKIIDENIRAAIAEDIASGDVTAALLPDYVSEGYVLCKEKCIVAGRPWFDACLKALDPNVKIHWHVNEGDTVEPVKVICTFEGSARAMVSAERSALNFLQTLSGTATVTASYANALQGTRTRVLDTRKTLPGLRQAQKYAVRAGGGVNHRMGLYDAVMLKENHVHAAGSITAAAAQAKARFPDMPLIIEVETLTQLREALDTDCARILIDDFSLEDMRAAVEIAAGKIPLEVSGSVTFERLAEIAAAGVDYVSIGALTKHIHAIDFSMKLGNYGH